MFFGHALGAVWFVATTPSNESNHNPTRTSPWACSEWRLDLNIGRETGTWMPEDWAASGGRLFFGVDCRIESSHVAREEAEQAWTGGRRPRQVTVLEDATYINAAGEQCLSIPEAGGGWSIQLPRQKGQAGTLRLWLDLEQADDLPDGLAAQKNDVTLLAADRLYLTAKCWRERDYEMGRRRMKPILTAARNAQEKLDAQLSHETGDRRLDGTNPLDLVKGSIDMAALVKERDDCVRALREAERILPNDDKIPQKYFGAWPGSTEGLVVATGAVSVKRKKLLQDEYHVVGTWKATPVREATEEQSL